MPRHASTYRRPYKKSTLGCNSCKSRRIKCDEARPVCGNCKKRFIDATACQYARQNHSPKPTALGEPTRMPVRPVTLDTSNTLALRLMHHYAVSISCNRSSFCSENARLINTLWTVEVPSMAFTSEVVMNALLGISAWHLWALNPQDHSLIMVSRAYFGNAIKMQRVALDQQDEHDLAPIYIAAVVLAQHNWLLSHTTKDFNNRQVKLETFHLCRGCLILGAKLSPAWSRYTNVFVTSGNTHLHQAKNNSFMERVIQDSDRLFKHVHNADINQMDKQVYRKAIEKILNIYALITNTNEDILIKENTVVSFLHGLPSSFISLLQHQEPMAVGLMARVLASLALLRNCSTSWYIHGAGDFQIDRLAVTDFMHSIPPDWKWIMDWPLEIVSTKFDPYAQQEDSVDSLDWNQTYPEVSQSQLLAFTN